MNKKKYNFGGNPMLQSTDSLAINNNVFAEQELLKQQKQDNLKSAAVGALQGGLSGAAFGPIGMGVGALAGALPHLFGNGGKLSYSEGGDMALTEFKGGGTHEENPNGGIPVGENALVEENETMADVADTKFVFSDRLKVGKSTFAKLSKSVNNKFKDYPHDKKANRAKEVLLAKLADKQEDLKRKKEEFELKQLAKNNPEAFQQMMQQNQEQQMPQEGIEQEQMPEEQMMYFGGQVGLPKVKILSKGGPADIWVAKTGLPWSEAKKRGLTDGTSAKNIALLNLLNAQNFDKDKFLNSSNTTNNTTNNNLSKHLAFSMDPTNQAMGAETIALVENDYRQKEYSKNLMGNLQPELDAHDKLVKSKNFKYPSNPISVNDESTAFPVKEGEFLDPETNEPLTLKNGKYYRKDELNDTKSTNNNKSDITTTTPDGDNFSLTPKYTPYLQAAGTIANAASGIYNVARGMKPIAKANLTRPKLSKIDLGREREAVKQAGATALETSNQNIRNVASSSGSALAASVANSAAINKNVGNMVSQSMQNEINANTQIQNQQNLAETDISNKEKEMNAMAEARRQKAIEMGLNTLGTATASGIKDFNMTTANNRYNERVLKLMKTGNWKYNPNTAEVEFIKAQKEAEKSKSLKYGGRLPLLKLKK
jgi:hypothetical protein